MRHFGIGHWTDYVRGLAAEDDAAAMRAHLEGGCETCSRVVASLREIVEAGSAAGEGAAPTIGAARDLMPESSVAERQQMELVWDSARAPFLLDAVGSESGRQLHFATGEFELNARVEGAADDDGALLMGRLQSRYQVPVTDLRVRLVSSSRVIDSIQTGELGEFELALGPDGPSPFELWIALDEEHELVAMLDGS